MKIVIKASTIYEDRVPVAASEIDREQIKNFLYIFYDTPGQISHRVFEFVVDNGVPRRIYQDDFEAAQDYLNDGGSPDKVKYSIGDTTFQVQKGKKSILISQPGGSWEMPRAKAARLYEQLYKSSKGDN